MENVLQRNLRTDRATECIFTVSGSTNFENLSAWHQPSSSTTMPSWVQDVCQDTSLDLTVYRERREWPIYICGERGESGLVG